MATQVDTSNLQPWADEDLGAVGAVGVPSPAGISFDPEPVVDLRVMPFADQPGVLQTGVALIGEPLGQMMDIAPVRRGCTPGEHAVPVPALHRPADVRR